MWVERADAHRKSGYDETRLGRANRRARLGGWSRPTEPSPLRHRETSPRWPRRRALVFKTTTRLRGLTAAVQRFQRARAARTRYQNFELRVEIRCNRLVRARFVRWCSCTALPTHSFARAPHEQPSV